MALADRLAAGPARRNTCPIPRVLAAMTDDDRAAFEAALDAKASPDARNHLWSAPKLSEELRAEGVDISQGVIGNHRRRECGCFREPR